MSDEHLTAACNPAAPETHTAAARPECAAYYTVEAGDTLYMISQTYEVPVDRLMQVNRIANPYNLKIGQRICIPNTSAEAMPEYPVNEEQNNPRPEPRSAQETIPPINAAPAMPSDVPGTSNTETQPMQRSHSCLYPEQEAHCNQTYIVEAGDTLYMIAKKHRITLDALICANPAMNPYNLRIGTLLCIPDCPK